MNTIRSNSIHAFYKCRTCAKTGKTRNGTDACAKFNIPINLETDFCAWHENDTKTKCSFCIRTDNLISEELEGQYYSFCPDHYKAFHSCQGCINSKNCELATDNSEPQTTTQTVFQNGMLFQTQVRNPKLVEKHCTSCRCGSTNETICFKDEGAGCQNWQPLLSIFQ